MAVEIGDVIRAVVQISMPDVVEANNVWDWERVDAEATSPTNNAVNAAIAAKIVEIYGEWAPSMADVCIAVASTHYKMGFELGQWVVQELMGTHATGVAGTNVNEMMPHGVCGLITMPTGISKTRGRRFFPGISENEVADGTLIAAALDNLLDAGEAYLEDITVSSIYTLRPKLLDKIGATRTFLSVGANGIPAYQRRRKPGVGS